MQRQTIFIEDELLARRLSAENQKKPGIDLRIQALEVAVDEAIAKAMEAEINDKSQAEVQALQQEVNAARTRLQTARLEPYALELPKLNAALNQRPLKPVRTFNTRQFAEIRAAAGSSSNH